MTRASDSISAATVADVRRGAWIRLSAASAPSTGRSRLQHRPQRARQPERQRRASAAGRPASPGRSRVERQRPRPTDGQATAASARQAAASQPPDPVLAGRQHLVLALLQRLDRIDPRRVRAGMKPATRLVATPIASASAISARVRAHLVGPLGHAVDALEERADVARHAARQQDAEAEAAPPTRPGPPPRSRRGTASGSARASRRARAGCRSRRAAASPRSRTSCR